MNRQDIPTVDIDQVDSGASSRWVLGWDRRQFLRAAAGTGMAIGLTSLGVFPPARKALASHPGTEGYQIKSLPCPGDYGYEDCGTPCAPSTIYQDACYTDPGHHYYGWHRHGCTIAYTKAWRLRQNGCDPGTQWDGWKWQVANCANCNSAVFRCHDGYRCQTGQNCDLSFCDNSVCKWLIGCT